MYKVFNHLPVTVLILASAFFINCDRVLAETQSYRSVVVYPLISSCVEYARSEMEKKKSEGDFEYEYFEFVRKLDSHPNVIGVLMLKSMTLNRTKLTRLLNSIRNDCHPNSHITIFRDNTNAWAEVSRIIELHNRLGFDKHYIVVTDDEIKIYFNQEALDHKRNNNRHKGSD